MNIKKEVQDFWNGCVELTRSLLRSTELKQVLLWCIPALIVGFALRAVLLVQMPYGFIQYDTPDFLTTPYQFLAKHHLVIHGKKSFLTPVFFLLPFILHIPALIFIPLAQNIMGLLGVVLAGGLVRLWFKQWRWFIVPVTVLIAGNPFAIWYEKTLMGEANFLFFALLLAVFGTLWAKNPCKQTFVLLLLGLFLNAGTRGEAKLYFAFGLALIPLVLWRQWGSILLHWAITLVVMVGTFHISETSHAPSLLYATLVHLTPDHLRFEPDIAPYVLPLRDRYRQEWVERQGELVQVAKVINRAIEPYVKEHYPAKHGKRNREMAADVFQRLCLDVLVSNPVGVALVPFGKFQQATDGWSSGVFDEGYLDRHQKNAATRGKWMTQVLSKGLTGTQMDDMEMKSFIDAHYDPKRIQWFADYQKAWNFGMIALRLPDRPMIKKRWVHDYVPGVPGGLATNPGMPFFYILAFAGMLAMMLRSGQLREAQVAWILATLFVWWSATLVGVTNARFRFVYEPQCILFIFALIDCLWDWASRLVGSKAPKETKETVECTTS